MRGEMPAIPITWTVFRDEVLRHLTRLEINVGPGFQAFSNKASQQRSPPPSWNVSHGFNEVVGIEQMTIACIFMLRGCARGGLPGGIELLPGRPFGYVVRGYRKDGLATEYRIDRWD